MRKFVCLFMLLIPATLFATDRTVFDVYLGKEWDLVPLYKNVKTNQPLGFKEVGISYFGFQDSIKPGLKKLNESIRGLAISSWQTERAFKLMSDDLKIRAKNYYRNSRSGSPGDGGEDMLFALVEDVELKPLSVYKDVCWLEMEFDITMRGDARFQLKKYYIADMTSGNIEEVTFESSIPDLEALRGFLAPLFSEQYLLVTDKLSAEEKKPRRYIDPEDELEEEESPRIDISFESNASVCKDLCKYIEFNEMNVYRLGWGLVVAFQEYSNSSVVYNNESFAIFLTGAKQDSLAMILHRPDLAADHRVISNDFKGFNYYKLSEGMSSMRQAPSIDKLVVQQQSADKRVNTLRVDSYQVFESGKANFRGYFVRIFDRKGFPASYCYVDERKDTVFSEYYQYDPSGNLVNSRGLSDRKKFKTESWQYDASGNLLDYRKLDGEDLYEGFFFYNGRHFYKIEMDGTSVRENQIEKVSFVNREVCFKTACYVLNEKYVPKYQSKRKYAFEEVQTGFDAKGRLMETHAENDRYNYYFNYDQSDRFVSMDTYEYQRAINTLKYLYRENDRLPYEQQKHSYSNGQDIYEKEVYTWEFY